MCAATVTAPSSQWFTAIQGLASAGRLLAKKSNSLTKQDRPEPEPERDTAGGLPCEAAQPLQNLKRVSDIEHAFGLRRVGICGVQTPARGEHAAHVLAVVQKRKNQLRQA